MPRTNNYSQQQYSLSASGYSSFGNMESSSSFIQSSEDIWNGMNQLPSENTWQNMNDMTTFSEQQPRGMMRTGTDPGGGPGGRPALPVSGSIIPLIFISCLYIMVLVKKLNKKKRKYKA